MSNKKVKEKILKLKAKLRSTSGETLIESLFGILIVTICMAALVVAIVAAAKINRQVKDTDISFKYSENASGSASTVVIKENSFEQMTIAVEMFEDADGHGYYYYSKAK